MVRVRAPLDEEEAGVGDAGAEAEDDAEDRVASVGLGADDARDEDDSDEDDRDRRGHPAGRPLAEEQPRGDGHDDDLGVAEDGRQPGSDLLDGVVPEHEIDREEDAGEPGEPRLTWRPRSVAAAFEGGQEEERRERVRAAEEGRRGRGDVGEPNEDRREGDGERAEHGREDRSFPERAEDGTHARQGSGAERLTTRARETYTSASMPELLTGTV